MTILTKLAQSAAAVQDARAIYAIKVEARNLLIVAALDEGYDQKTVARAAHLDPSTVMTIVAKSDNMREQIRTPE